MEALGPADPVQVGPYRLVGRLGEGGMGRVFLGRSPGGRPVAVKMVRPEYAADSRFRQRFAATGRGAFGEGHPWAVLNNIVQADPDLADVPDATLREVIAACLAKEPGDRPGLEELLTWLLDPAPTPQAWLPPAVRDLTASYSVKDASPAGPDQAAPTRQLHDPPTPAWSGARPPADIPMEPYNQFVRAARRFQEQPAYVRARHREQLNDLAVKLSTVLPIVEEHPTRRSHHYADALSDVRLYILNLSHFLVPDAGSVFDDHN